MTQIIYPNDICHKYDFDSMITLQKIKYHYVKEKLL
jgi:hypothetical protein